MKKKVKTKLKNIKEKKCGVVSARKWVRENDVMRNDRIVWQDAMPYEGVVSKGHEWNTDCGRYRIKRACQKYGGDAKMPDAFYVEFRNEYTDKLTGRKNQWWDCIPVKPRSTQCKEFGCLQDALEAAEMLHRERTGREDVQSNAEQIRSAAKKQGLSELPSFARVVRNDSNRVSLGGSEVKSVKRVGGSRNCVSSGVGIIATIIDCLKSGSEASPLSREDILKVLVKKFPDRAEASMKSTVSHQVPSYIRKRGIEVKTNGNSGFWIVSV